jgi:GntR family transcriptional regulator, transcriptional repressor for pyruvate dehydrogenase complex
MDQAGQGEQTRHVYEGIRGHIQELIHKGELRVGDKLPPERKLAETFKVSRNSVREAIRALAEKNILRSRRGDGTYILASDESTVTDSLRQAVQGQRKRIEEIFEFRRLLEPQIAFLAARNMSRKEIDRLKILVVDQERRIMAGRDDADLDVAFHLLVAGATGNSVIHEVAKTLSHILGETRSEALQSEERRQASVRTHILIIDALERGDGEGAREAMHRHLAEIERTVFDGKSEKQGRALEQSHQA